MENGFNTELALGYFDPDRYSNIEQRGLLMLLIAASLFGSSTNIDTENLPEDIRALLHKYADDKKENDK